MGTKVFFLKPVYEGLLTYSELNMLTWDEFYDIQEALLWKEHEEISILELFLKNGGSCPLMGGKK